MKANNPVRKSIIMLVTFAIAFASMVSLACDENPCADGSACGITSPVTSAEQVVIDAIQPNQENILSGGN